MIYLQPGGVMGIFLALVAICLLVIGAAAVLLNVNDPMEEKTNKGLVGAAWFIIIVFVIASILLISYLCYKRWHK